MGVQVPRCLHPEVPKKGFYGELRRHLGGVFRTLTEQKECRVEEGYLMPDHVHMMLSIPPKYSVAQVVGYIKRAVPADRSLPGKPAHSVQ